MNFKGKKVLVTGSSRGIGKATALEFARKGADVAVSYVESREKAEKVRDEIKSMGRNSIAIQADISSQKDVKRMMEKTTEALGGLDILVNNAGTINPSPINDFDKEGAMRTLEVNVIGNLICSKEALPYLKKGEEPAIVNVASDFGELPAPGAPVYGASKAGVIEITKSLAKQLAPDIRVNAVAPGMTKTDMTADADKEHIQETIKKTPMDKIDEPRNVAQAITFLASNKASFTTGETIFCDGGYFLK